MKSMRYFLMFGSVCAFLLGGISLTLAQEPPHVDVEKVVETTGEICPGFIVDVRITLYGNGSAGYIREPIDAVCVIDKSGSMTWGGSCCYHVNAEPPYGPPPPSCPDPWTGGTKYHPYVDAVWAAWKFYEYLVDVPPSIGYKDYGGLIFFDNSNEPGGVPGVYGVTSPTEIQGTNPKEFWWNNHLALQNPGGSTAMGCGMQRAKEMLQAMPTHPAPLVTPGDPTPPTPYYDVKGRRYMVVLTDGRPNVMWSHSSSDPNPSWSNPVEYCREMARRSSLVNPWNDFYGNYTDTGDITIYSIGLGAAVDGILMSEIADPWSFIPFAFATPVDAHSGEYLLAQTEADLIDVFQTIASAITSDRAGKDIVITETWGDGTCGGGEQIYTDIIPGSWNPAPDIIYPTPPTPGNPTPPPEYVWDFDELLVDDEINITFQIQVLNPPLESTDNLLECPESKIEYITYHDDPVASPISDPKFSVGICYTPVPTISPTVTATPTVTPTPTCLITGFYNETFESGLLDNFDSYGPSNQIRILSDSAENGDYAYEGNYCVFFAGSDVELGPSEAHMMKVVNLADPSRPGAVLDYMIKLKNLRRPEKIASSGPRATPTAGNYEDRFLVAVEDDPAPVAYYSVVDQYQHGEDVWFHGQVDLSPWKGQEFVRIYFRSDYPLTNPNVDPDDPIEPMVFLDNIRIIDYCYEGSPTPTVTSPPPPRLPASSPVSIVLILFLISSVIIFPVFRRRSQ